MCPQPPNIANGLHSGQSMDKVLPGAVVNYSCKDGFELVGNVSISCSEVGRWSRPLPRCQGGWKQPCGHCCSVPAGCCPALTAISVFPQPSAVRVPRCTMGSCRRRRTPTRLGRCCSLTATLGMLQRAAIGLGASLGGAGTHQCSDVSAVSVCAWCWGTLRGCHPSQCPSQPPVPLRAPLSSPCLPAAVRPCPMPPKISNGDHNRHGEAFFTAGMSVTYSCDPTFYLVGNAHVVCRASGTWSQPSPRCEGASVLTVGSLPTPPHCPQVLQS